MTQFDVEQALFGETGPDEFRLLARSPAFADKWLARAEDICRLFGSRPQGVRCPGCVFAVPFERNSIAVAQVADQTDIPERLCFRLLVISLDLYAHRIGDPFQVAERFPPPWQTRAELPGLIWPDVPPAARSVEQ